MIERAAVSRHDDGQRSRRVATATLVAMIRSWPSGFVRSGWAGLLVASANSEINRSSTG